VGNISEPAGSAAGAEAEDGEGVGGNDLLLLVKGRGASLEHAELLQGTGTTGGLVGGHAADGAVEHL